jgi:membrane protein DedA with SNARE-associated domain
MTGFFEETRGVKSMTRLVMFLLTLLASLLVGVIAFYVGYQITRKPTAAAVDWQVIGAIVGGITAVVLNGVVAIRYRSMGQPEPPEPPAAPIQPGVQP